MMSDLNNAEIADLLAGWPAGCMTTNWRNNLKYDDV